MNKLLPLALLLIGCSSGPASPTSAGANTANKDKDEESNAPDFTLTDVEGRSVSLSEHLGTKVILIDFWATWCKPCIAEMAHIQKIYEKRKDNFIVLAVSMDASETEAQVAPTVKTKGWTFPVLLDPETRVVSLYNPRRAAPYTVLIDRHGKIVKKREGYNPGDEAEIEKDIDAAMK